jgi:hypothetical protein
VQNKVVPNIYGDGGTPSSWIAVLDQVEKLGAAHVLPTHSPVGDGSLVAKEKAFIVDLRARALNLKQQGVDADKAGGLLTAEFKTSATTRKRDFKKSGFCVYLPSPRL